jgi:hypothetical protein
MSPRIYISGTIIAALSLIYGFGVFANVDMGYEQQACIKKKYFVQDVTNGTCYGIIIGRGIENILLRGDGETVGHRYPQGCENIDWKEANPEWETKTCAPTFSCLENSGVDLTNASFISAQEQPYQNAPEVNPPIFPLDKDYLKTLVFADNVAVSDTADLCQYTCNDGYRQINGPCGTTATTTTSAAGSCTVAPTVTIAGPTGSMTGVNAVINPTNITTNFGVTVATQGSGYATAPAVTINIPNNGTCSPYTPNIKTVVTGGKVTSASLQVLAPTVQVNFSDFLATASHKMLIFAVVNGGAGYQTAPTVTIGGLTGAGCTVPTPVPHLNNRGELATIDDLQVPQACLGIPTITVSAPPALVPNITCPVNTTLTVAEPTGTVNGEGATATVALAGTGFDITVTNGGSGYTSNPAVTVTGGTCTQTPVGTATIDPATKKVTAVTLSFGGTTAYAISNDTGTTAAIPTNGGGAGYTTAPLVTVTG